MTDRLPGRLAWVAFLLSAPALAWSDIGHRIICETAFQELESTARERVQAMTRRDPEHNAFADACTWPGSAQAQAAEHQKQISIGRDRRLSAPARLKLL